MSNPFLVAEDGHLVNILAPVDITGAATTSDAWTMRDHSHASIILTMGVTGAASTVTLEECTDAAGTDAAETTINCSWERSA